MEYYLLIAFACLLGGVRLAFNKMYVNRYGSALRSALWFLFLCCGIFFVMMLAIRRDLDFSLFSVILALIFAVINVGCTLFGFMTLAIGNVSTYTLVLQLGGMLVPFFYGITFGNDNATLPKWICMLLITAALFVSIEHKKGGKSSRKALLYYALLFTLNGLACVVLSVHQQIPTPFGARAVGTDMFTMLYMAFTSLFALIAVIILRIRDGKPQPPVKHGLDILLAGGYGVFYGFANLISAECLLHIEPSAQFPILTGGSVIIAGLVGLFFKEKITWRFVVAATLVMVGTLLLLPWKFGAA